MSLSAALTLSIIAGYFCGSLPFGYWAGLIKGVDVRKHGSGNIGATNVIRVLGKGVGIPVFILDVLKGLAPVLLAGFLMRKAAVGAVFNPAWMSAAMVAAGLAAVLGHMFTCWLQFKGGKGVATAAGVLAGIAPFAMLCGLLVWLAFFFATKYVSLASMLAAAAVPVAMALTMSRDGKWDWVLLGFGILIAVLVVLRHRANISRLIAGTESRVGRKMEKKDPA